MESDTKTPRTRCVGGDVFGSIKKFIFVLGSALVIFGAARNTLTWQLQRFWGASGNFWQNLFDSIASYMGNDDLIIGLIGPFLVTSLSYTVFNLFFLFIDLTGRPQCLMKYKIQPGINEPVEFRKAMRAIKVVYCNQLFFGFPFYVCLYYILRARGVTFRGDLPTFHWALFELLIYSICEEIGFYYSHRLMHQPWFYKNIHKMHHEWTAPISVTSMYCKPVEFIVCNLTPTALGIVVMGSHIGTFFMWMTIAAATTTLAHCGYHFPFLTSPEAHDFHHYKPSQNFGTLGVLDRLHGTDEIFRASKAYQRHIMSLSLVPLREQFPDDDKNKNK